jgi:hypothetical protein
MGRDGPAGRGDQYQAVVTFMVSRVLDCKLFAYRTVHGSAFLSGMLAQPFPGTQW